MDTGRWGGQMRLLSLLVLCCFLPLAQSCTTTEYSLNNTCYSCHNTCFSCNSSLATNCTVCKSSASLTAVGECMCDPGYYRENSTGNCLPCESTCSQCAGPAPSNCTTCLSPAVLSSGTCICPNGYTRVGNTTACQPCHSTCFSCNTTDIYGCLSCSFGKILAGTAPNACVCPSSTYFDGITCLGCNAMCQDCINGQECTSCYGSAILQGTQCKCVNGYFLNTTTKSCNQCDPTCATCSGALQTNCLSCGIGMSLNGTAPTACLCNFDYYLNSTGGCSQCDISCHSCSSAGPNSCLSCAANATLIQATCNCLVGYFPSPSPSSCQLCDMSCKTCQGSLASNCSSCYGYAALQGAPPSICSCQSGFYPAPDSSQCKICDSSCLTCNSTGTGGCLRCRSNANLAGPAPNSCVCVSHFFPSPSALNCSICAVQCLDCTFSSPQNCSSCAADAYLSAGQCICKSGYFRNSTTLACQTCAQFCQNCTGPASTQCTSCPIGLQLTGNLTGSCTCPSGNKPNAVTGQCLQCHPSCLTCADTGENQCTKCAGTLQLLQPAPGYCSCGLGYYLKTNSTCELCDITCASCQNGTATSCTGCKQGAKLSNGVCACDQGYYPDVTAANCSACQRNCLNCSNAEICLKCGDGYFLANQQCQGCRTGCFNCSDPSKCLSCISGLYLTLKGECIDCPTCGQPFTASVTSPSDHKYVVSFNHNCTYPFTYADFVFSTEPVSNITWAVETANPLLISVRGGPWYVNTIFRISFPHPNYIFDVFGAVLTISSLEIPAPTGAALLTPNSTSSDANTTDTSSSDSSSNTTSETTLTAQEQSVATASQQSSNAVAAGALASGALIGSSAAMALVTQMQYFSFIGSTGVSLPGGMGGMYSGMNQKSMLPNFFSKGRTGSGRRLNTSDVFDFLEEAGSFISLLTLLLCLHLLIRLISLPCSSKLPKALSWALHKFEWSLYLDFMSFAYLDLTLNSLSQLQKANFPASDVRSALNITLSCSILLLLVLFPLFTFSLIRKHRGELFVAEELLDGRVKEESAIRKKWEKLINGVREDVVYAQYLQPVSYVQRFVYAFILVFLSPGKWLCLGLIFPSMWITAFVVAFRPDDSAAQRFLHIVTEVQTLLLFASIFLVKVLSDGELELGWLIVILSMGAMACGVISFLIDVREKIANLCRKICCKPAAIKAEAYEVNTSTFEDQNNSILSTSSLYPSHKEMRLRGNIAAVAWAPVARPQRRLPDEGQEVAN